MFLAEVVQMLSSFFLILDHSQRTLCGAVLADSASAGTGGNLGFEKGMDAESPTSCVLLKNSYSDLQLALT